MNEETIKTFVLCAFFVFFFGALGFLVASIINAVKIYIESLAVEMYYIWVETKMFATSYLLYYLLGGFLFSVVALFFIHESHQFHLKIRV
jgi:hypothetical protein